MEFQLGPHNPFGRRTRVFKCYEMRIYSNWAILAPRHAQDHLRNYLQREVLRPAQRSEDLLHNEPITAGSPTKSSKTALAFCRESSPQAGSCESSWAPFNVPLSDRANSAPISLNKENPNNSLLRHLSLRDDVPVTAIRENSVSIFLPPLFQRVCFPISAADFASLCTVQSLQIFNIFRTSRQRSTKSD